MAIDSETELEQYLEAKRARVAVDPTQAAAELQEASEMQRQKFMNVFQQMQSSASPAILAQKTYKVKSESKQPQSAVLFPPYNNPFSRAVKPIGIDDSESLLSTFRPFEPVSPPKDDKPSIFEKLDKQALAAEQ